MSDTTNLTSSLTPTRNIKVVNKDTSEILFTGLSNDTKAALVEQYGENIDVYYEQLYTTVLEDQSYAEALIDINSKTKHCFTRQEFEQFLQDEFVTSGYSYIAYSQKDLARQKPANTKSSIKKNTAKINNGLKVGLFFYTSMSDVPNGEFPVPDMTAKQISFAKEVLETEDYYVKELGEPQVEGILIITGSPTFNDAYISKKYSNLKFITMTEDGQPTKGLIKNSVNADGIQVYVLRLCIKQVNGVLVEKRNIDVLRHVGYIQ